LENDYTSITCQLHTDYCGTEPMTLQWETSN
jgi:hypothetical protein